MNSTTARGASARRVLPRCAACRGGERLANWLGLLALLALGIVWR
jgi:hypothetical protein